MGDCDNLVLMCCPFSFHSYCKKQKFFRCLIITVWVLDNFDNHFSLPAMNRSTFIESLWYNGNNAQKIKPHCHYSKQYCKNGRLTHMENHGSKQLRPALLATCFTLVSCMTYSLTLKMQGTCSSETLVDFQQTTLCYIPEDRTGRDVFPLINILIIHVQVCFTSVTLQTCVCCFFSLTVS
jgi:hypothetical protein